MHAKKNHGRMTRAKSSLLVTAALALAATSAGAQTVTINGGGSDTQAKVLVKQLTKHNSGSGLVAGPLGAPPGNSGPFFGAYWVAGSAASQIAFLTDDLTCDIDAATGRNRGACAGPAGAPGNTVEYAAPDDGLSGAQIAFWASSSLGQALAGNLIQLPSMGAGLALVLDNAAITAAGAATLSDDDLCGIFSGLITNAAQITDSATPLAPGPLTVIYRADSAGETLWLTGHLAAVCSARTAAIAFSPTPVFTSLFPKGVPATFMAAGSQNAVAADLAGCGALPNPVSAIGYLTPDLTALAPKSLTPITCASGKTEPSPLLTAAVVANGQALLPTQSNIRAGLLAPVLGKNLRAPATQAAAANPANWAPLVQTVKHGYPLVGYTLFDFAQCYAATNVAATIVSLLSDHYRIAGYTGYEVNNLFVPLNAIPQNGYLAAIDANILANANTWNLDIGNAIVCPKYAGR